MLDRTDSSASTASRGRAVSPCECAGDLAPPMMRFADRRAEFPRVNCGTSTGSWERTPPDADLDDVRRPI